MLIVERSKGSIGEEKEVIYITAWQGLGVCLFLSVIGITIWYWWDASCEKEVQVMQYLPTEKRVQFNKKKYNHYVG